MSKIDPAVFLDLATVDQGDLDLSPLYSVWPEWQMHQSTNQDKVANRIKHAKIVVTNKLVIDSDCFAAAPMLELLCVTATGYNNIDLDAARESDVAVSNVTAYATASVVQHVFALMLAHFTHLQEYTSAVRAGEWQRSKSFCLLNYPIREIAGMTLGIVGYGELGKAVAQVAEAFAMKVLISERPGGPAQKGRVPLNDLLPQVDVLSLHVPLADNTFNLIGPDELAAMKADALLINTARGQVVNNTALAEALRSGEIGGAALDVLDAEPPGDDHPLLAAGVPNLIVTPHVAWASRQARQRVLDEVSANIQSYLAGQRRNRVT